MLESINSPADLKNLSKAQLKDLCGEIRKYIIDCCAVNPGHLGSSLGAVELIVGLHYVFDTPHDKIVYDDFIVNSYEKFIIIQEFIYK